MRSSSGRPGQPGRAVAVLAAATLTLVGLGAAPALAAGPPRVPVDNAQPALTGASVTGTPDADDSVPVTVYLRNRDQAGLTRLIDRLSDPASANYGQYLTAAQFSARFAPTRASVAAVRDFLTDSGLTVTGVAGNSAYVEARGPVSKVQKAFSTTLKNYRQKKTTFRAASSTPTVPSALDDVVLGVSGLASVSQLMTPASTGSAPPSDAFVNAGPCSTYYGQKTATTLPSAYGKKQPYAPCGYEPDQLQGAYGITGAIDRGNNGKGVTVAITDAYASPTARADANTYATRHGQKALGARQYTEVLPSSYRYGYDDAVNGDQCGEQGWYGEQTLDIEAVHATAPGANITYVASPSCDNADFAKTLIKVVSGHLADIVTNSWGGSDESNGSDLLDQVYQAVFQQAAVTGIGFYFSSGDSGDGASGNAGTPTAQAPANSPYVTAVGGTSLAVAKNDTRIWETGWSTGRSALSADGTSWDPAPPGDYLYGAGGGTSRVYAQPKYQKGVVPRSLATRYSTRPARVVPDVSALGDPNTGMLVGQTQTFPDGTVRYGEYRIGGTSLASPLFAGIMALADQAAGRPHGFANPALYKLYGSGALYDPKPKGGLGVVRNDYVNGVDATDGTSFTLRSIDVTVGTILRTRTGYDDITGIGSPSGKAFLKKLS
ncbi:S8 family serine peptidase [Kineosporia sp. J2-2]|uniref:S8 family serine peptidase n=1 Tax=Kineosporia corallincola TaxID=2835133 RepID=A0ABS5TN07_9ACTN|nr:S53 family serine peptidase [Kineosporia corallincola]MBT0772486.1 S8 family serine peptidase [Kineosporia corallincola]